MVELHVDTCEYAFQLGNKRTTYGGNLSVRFPTKQAKPIVIFGQDECAFNQFLMGNRQWVGPTGQRALLPKTEGAMIMILAFQSREFGFRFQLDDRQLQIINSKRNGETYKDEEAAMTINKTIQKPSLTSSPFIKMFELGQNNEGYWTYNHMVLQLEDCIDCLQVVHPEFEYVFLFDHSSGHAKKRKDGLDGGSMLRGYGGSQVRIHSSEMREVDGYLGSYPRVLEKGDS